MKLVAQVAAGVALGIFGIWFLMAMGSSSPAHSSRDRDSITACDNSAVVSAAASKLAEWLNEKIGKDNAYHVHGSFVAEISMSVEMGVLQGTHQCMSIASVGIKHAGGSLRVAPETINLHFLLTGDQITFDEGELLSAAANTADSLLVQEAFNQQPDAVTQPAPPSSKN